MTLAIRNVKYTTLDRLATFTFDFVQSPGGAWRAYIRDQPSYGTRPTSAHSSHRLQDQGGHYVCWAPEPTTLNEAKGAARAWADATHEYIRTGSFPSPAGPRHVPDVSTSADWAFGDLKGVIPAPELSAPRPPARPPQVTPRSTMHVTTSRPVGLRSLFTRRTR